MVAGGVVQGGSQYSALLLINSGNGSTASQKTKVNYVANDMFCGSTYIAIAETKLLATGPYSLHQGQHALISRV